MFSLFVQELEQYHGDYQKGKQSCGLHGDASMAIVQDSMSDFIMERYETFIFINRGII